MLIECVPNFSEGRNHEVIEQIAHSIRSVEGVKLLEVDIGFDANENEVILVFRDNEEPVAKADKHRIAHTVVEIAMGIEKDRQSSAAID